MQLYSINDHQLTQRLAVGYSSRRLGSFALSTLIAPAALLAILQQWTTYRPSRLEFVGVYIALVITKLYTMLALKQYEQTRRASAAGAVLVPKVKGAWPWNLDVDFPDSRLTCQPS